jgi:hypothetical protein
MTNPPSALTPLDRAVRSLCGERPTLEESADLGPKARAELAALRSRRTYAHMCRADHVEIGFNDSEIEPCPLCDAMNRRAPLAAAAQRTGLPDAITREAARVVSEWSETFKVAPDCEDPPPLLSLHSMVEASIRNALAAAGEGERAVMRRLLEAIGPHGHADLDLSAEDVVAIQAFVLEIGEGVAGKLKPVVEAKTAEAVAAERERCAKIAESEADRASEAGFVPLSREEGWHDASWRIAERIRSQRREGGA